MFKLAFSNIKAKPLRAVGVIVAIAITVAMIFCMLSFKDAVYEYIYASEASNAGSADVRIATHSSSSRILDVASPLESVEEIDEIVPSLTLYALFEGEYVQLRGYQRTQLESLQKIDVASGSIAEMSEGVNTDNVVISQAAAEHFGVKVGDRIHLALGTHSCDFYVGAIAVSSGYFLSDAPYQFVGLTTHVAKLIGGVEASICNEIYIKLKEGADTTSVIEKISAMSQYSNLIVEVAKDDAYVSEQTDSLTAPVVLAGAAVVMLGLASIVLLFLMSENEKVALLSKLTVVGATKKQALVVFLIESVTLAFVGVVLGGVIAGGVFIALLKITLSSALTFLVSPIKLFLATAIGFVASILGAMLPIVRAMKGTIRQNQLNTQKASLWQRVLPIVLVATTIICVTVEFCVESVTGVFGVLSLVLALLTLGVLASIVMRRGGKLTQKSSNPSVKLGSVAVVREKRFSRSVTMLTVGMTIAMMLFMAYSLTTSIFDAYISDFENMAFITNIQQSLDTAQIEQVDGVEAATKIVWEQAKLAGDDFDKTVNVLGAKETLDYVNFEFITPKDTVKVLIEQNEPYVFVDVALSKLYGVKTGDTLNLTLNGEQKQVIVGGILKHNLFSGNYVVASQSVLEELFGAKAETVLVVTNKDASEVVNTLRAQYATNNYYVVETLEAYRWEQESMSAVFDLVGTLAVTVGIFILVVSIASSLVGRSVASKERNALLNAGMSKRGLLLEELWQYFSVAIVAFVLSFAVSVLLTSSLIHALRLFGLYFEFMYKAWVVALVGAVGALGYTLVPLALNFKKGYNIKKD